MIPDSEMISEEQKEKPTFLEAAKFWAVLGCISFGGPVAQLPILHTEVIERKRWVSEEEFSRALALASVLPGPEAQQVATYLGWKLHGIPGGLISGGLFVLPSAILLLAISFLYVWLAQSIDLQLVLLPLRAVVLGIILISLTKLLSKRLNTLAAIVVAIAALINCSLRVVPFSLMLLVSALVGAILLKPATEDKSAHSYAKFSWKPLLTGGIIAVVWLLPLFLTYYYLGPENRLTEVVRFFSKTSLLTFGGAYAILPHVAATTVSDLHWLSASEMIDALSLAEGTPGPLIIVLQFVGFLACYKQSYPFDPAFAAILGAFFTSWALFVPSWFWMLTLGPVGDRLARLAVVQGAMFGIMAAVGGNMTHLAGWFAFHCFDFTSLTVSICVLLVTLLSIFAQSRLKFTIAKTAGVGALSSVLLLIYQMM